MAIIRTLLVISISFLASANTSSEELETRPKTIESDNPQDMSDFEARSELHDLRDSMDLRIEFEPLDELDMPEILSDTIVEDGIIMRPEIDHE